MVQAKNTRDELEHLDSVGELLVTQLHSALRIIGGGTMGSKQWARDLNGFDHEALCMLTHRAHKLAVEIRKWGE